MIWIQIRKPRVHIGLDSPCPMHHTLHAIFPHAQMLFAWDFFIPKSPFSSLSHIQICVGSNFIWHAQIRFKIGYHMDNVWHYLIDLATISLLFPSFVWQNKNSSSWEIRSHMFLQWKISGWASHICFGMGFEKVRQHIKSPRSLGLFSPTPYMP